MQKINTRDFKAHSGKYTDLALLEPVVIQKHKRDSVVIISYDTFTYFEKIKEELEDLKLAIQVKEIRKSAIYISKDESIKRLTEMLNDEE